MLREKEDKCLFVDDQKAIKQVILWIDFTPVKAMNFHTPKNLFYLTFLVVSERGDISCWLFLWLTNKICINCSCFEYQWEYLSLRLSHIHSEE